MKGKMHVTNLELQPRIPNHNNMTIASYLVLQCEFTDRNDWFRSWDNVFHSVYANHSTGHGLIRVDVDVDGTRVFPLRPVVYPQLLGLKREDERGWGE